jgi:hypothetical protein
LEIEAHEIVPIIDGWSFILTFLTLVTLFVFRFALFVCVKIWRKEFCSHKKSDWLLRLNYILLMALLLWFFAWNYGVFAVNPKLTHREAVKNLKAIASAQNQYHAAHQTYAGGADAFNLLKDWLNEEFIDRSERNRRLYNYHYHCGDDVLESYLSKYQSPTDWRLSETPKASADQFTCFATRYRDVWMINENGELYHLFDQVTGREIYDPGDGAPDYDDYLWGKVLNDFLHYHHPLVSLPSAIISLIAIVLMISVPVNLLRRRGGPGQ